jgi:hypothetical protein
MAKIYTVVDSNVLKLFNCEFWQCALFIHAHIYFSSSHTHLPISHSHPNFLHTYRLSHTNTFHIYTSTLFKHNTHNTILAHSNTDTLNAHAFYYHTHFIWPLTLVTHAYIHTILAHFFVITHLTHSFRNDSFCVHSHFSHVLNFKHTQARTHANILHAPVLTNARFLNLQTFCTQTYTFHTSIHFFMNNCLQTFALSHANTLFTQRLHQLTHNTFSLVNWNFGWMERFQHNCEARECLKIWRKNVKYRVWSMCGKIGFLPDRQMHVMSEGAAPIYVET